MNLGQRIYNLIVIMGFILCGSGIFLMFCSAYSKIGFFLFTLPITFPVIAVILNGFYGMIYEAVTGNEYDWGGW